MDIKKSCLNCEYFSRFYVKKLNKLQPIMDGICTKRKLCAKEKKQIPFLSECEEWAQDEARTQRKQAVTESIQEMKNRLDDIALLLIDDKSC